MSMMDLLGKAVGDSQSAVRLRMDLVDRSSVYPGADASPEAMSV